MTSETEVCGELSAESAHELTMFLRKAADRLKAHYKREGEALDAGLAWEAARWRNTMKLLSHGMMKLEGPKGVLP